MKKKLTLMDILFYPIIINPLFIVVLLLISIISLLEPITTETLQDEKYIRYNLTKAKLGLIESLEMILTGIVNLFIWNENLAIDYAEFLTDHLYSEKYRRNITNTLKN